MQLKFMSVYVTDQDHALQFYTSVLGFTKMADIPMGSFRWLTVVSSDGIDGVELVLEPLTFEPARIYQRALFEAGIPIVAFITKEFQTEVARLRSKGVHFKSEPKAAGPIIRV